MMHKQIMSEGELFRFFMDQANLLRGKMESDSYKNFLFPLIFYKFICDTYDEEYETAFNKTHSEKEAESPRYHKFIIPKDCHWDTIRNASSDIGAVIEKNLNKIEKANAEVSYDPNGKGILDGIFGQNIEWSDKNALPDYLLQKVIEKFSAVDISIKNVGGDALGRAYEYMLGQFAEDAGQTAQEFFTNRTLVTMMAEILKIENGDSIYDPTCGTAGMLLMSRKYAEKEGIDLRTLSFYGQEYNPLSVSISRINMMIHDIEDFDIEQGDTISDPKFKTSESTLQTFNVVMANPPYSIKDWDAYSFSRDRFGRNMLGVPKSNADFVFIQHILKSMEPETGRAAILLPHGLLSSKAETELRRELVKSDLLDCIIGVSKGLFYNSPMEACVFICRSKKSPDMVGKTKFIEASKQFVKNGNHNDLSEENIKFIRDVYFNPKEVDGVSAIVDNESLLEDPECSLTVDSQLCRLSYPEIYPYSESKKAMIQSRESYHDTFCSIDLKRGVN